MVHKILSVCYQQCLPDKTIRYLEHAGLQMTCVRNPGAALQIATTETFDLILINQTVSGPQEHLLVQLVREKSDVPVIFVSEDTHSKHEDVTLWLKPPVSPEELLRSIKSLLEK